MQKKIIVALDFSDKAQVFSLLSQLSPARCRVKIGLQMFTLYGPVLVKEIIALGFDVFLDLKLHDIPHTVAKSVEAACQLGVWMLTLHVQGGLSMLLAARHAADQFSGRPPLLMGVTVLTSLDANDLLLTTCQEVSVKDYASHLALLADQQQLDGVVCSAHEIEAIRKTCRDDFILVTPGIRLSDQKDDQKRIVTPGEAIALGADYLVIGRAITQAASPAFVLNELFDVKKGDY